LKFEQSEFAAPASQSGKMSNAK